MVVVSEELSSQLCFRYAGINVDRKELNKDDGDFASVLITMTKC